MDIAKWNQKHRTEILVCLKIIQLVGSQMIFWINFSTFFTNEDLVFKYYDLDVPNPILP